MHVRHVRETHGQVSDLGLKDGAVPTASFDEVPGTIRGRADPCIPSLYFIQFYRVIMKLQPYCEGFRLFQS